MPQPSHVTRDGPLGDPEPQLQQLAVDPRSAPPVLARHPPDKFSDLPSDQCPAWRHSPPGEPPPVEAEARAVPPDHRLRLHDDDRLGPSCPHAPQHHTERPVHQPAPRPTLLQEGGELLTEGQVLDHEAALRPEPRDHSSDDRPEKSNQRGRRGCRPWPKTSTVLDGTRFWRGTASDYVKHAARGHTGATLQCLDDARRDEASDTAAVQGEDSDEPSATGLEIGTKVVSRRGLLGCRHWATSRSRGRAMRDGSSAETPNAGPRGLALTVTEKPIAVRTAVGHLRSLPPGGLGRFRERSTGKRRGHGFPSSSIAEAVYAETPVRIVRSRSGANSEECRPGSVLPSARAFMSAFGSAAPT